MSWLLVVAFLGNYTIYHNGVIYTLDAENTKASVLVTQDGRIDFVGNRVPKYAEGPTETRVDLKGRTIIPGLIDAHCHLSSLGKSLETVDLRGVKSYETLVAAVASAAADKKPGTWVVGRGWDQNLWPKPTLPHHQALSQSVPKHPVCLYRIDGHACLINAAAMAASGIDNDTPDPPGGRLIRQNGQLTGVLVDAAMDQLKLPQASDGDMERWLRAAATFANTHGLTGIHDASVNGRMLAAYHRLAERGALTLRSYLMVDSADAVTTDRVLAQGPQVGLHNGLVTVRSLKAFADGALGSRGAWLKQPYTDDPQNRGLQTVDPNAFANLLDRALAAGFQVNTHAIGDQANHFVLEQIAQAHQRAKAAGDTRFRIEHAQIVDPEDMPKFKEYGVLPSMQPTHCTSDMGWADERLGTERLIGAYAWRSFRDLGLKIPLGSDFPVEHVNPFFGLYAAVSRQDLDGNPPQGFFPQQRLTRLEALLGFTLWAAYGAFQEAELGTLEKGKWADFVVLDDDYFSVDTRDIPKISVALTVVGGKIVYGSL